MRTQPTIAVPKDSSSTALQSSSSSASSLLLRSLFATLAALLTQTIFSSLLMPSLLLFLRYNCPNTDQLRSGAHLVACKLSTRMAATACALYSFLACSLSATSAAIPALHLIFGQPPLSR
ncbi:TPA: hypothetical protein ACH3X1_016751 [Trebouxia sp. C0004]